MDKMEASDRNAPQVVLGKEYIHKGKNILTPTTKEIQSTVRLIEQPKIVENHVPFSVPSAEKEKLVPAEDGLSDKDVLKHTASLWKYNPIPTNEPEPFKEFITECVSIGKYHITAARVRGKKHKHEGTNCDDWFETRSIGDFIVIAVSDGAGSKKFSRIGAKSSCIGAMQYLERTLDYNNFDDEEIQSVLVQDVNGPCFQQMASRLAGIAQDAVTAARKNVVEAFQKRRGNPRYTSVINRELQLSDFAATFLLTITLPLHKTGELLVITCQVGDGITAALNTKAHYGQIVTLLGEADSGDFSGETEFLTSPSICSRESLMKRTKVARKRFDIVMSMTDGVSDDYDSNGEEMVRLYADLCVNRILELPNLKQLCESIVQSEISGIRKNIPKAQAYPSVSESIDEKMVPIQYTRELCELNKINLHDMWENYQKHLALMITSMLPASGKNAAVKLKEWLDNYVVRGSFDDRTLVILQRGGDWSG